MNPETKRNVLDYLAYLAATLVVVAALLIGGHCVVGCVMPKRVDLHFGEKHYHGQEADTKQNAEDAIERAFSGPEKNDVEKTEG